MISVTEFLQQNSEVYQELAQGLTALEIYSSSCYRIYTLVLMLLSQELCFFFMDREKRLYLKPPIEYIFKHRQTFIIRNLRVKSLYWGLKVPETVLCPWVQLVWIVAVHAVKISFCETGWLQPLVPISFSATPRGYLGKCFRLSQFKQYTLVPEHFLTILTNILIWRYPIKKLEFPLVKH